MYAILVKSLFTSSAVPAPPSQDLNVASRTRTATRLSISTGTAWLARIPPRDAWCSADRILQTYSSSVMRALGENHSKSGSAIPMAGSHSHKVARFPPVLNLLFSPTWVLIYTVELSSVRLIASSPDRDGAIDLLITTCSSVSRSTGLGTNCVLNIAYNTQLPLCAPSTSFPLSSDPATAAPCRNPAALCIADTNFSFSFSGPVRSRRVPSTLHLMTIWFNLNTRTT